MFPQDDWCDAYEELEQMVDEQDLIELCNDDIWRTKDMREIPIKKMKTAHIKNCLNMIQQNNWRIMYEVPLLIELKRREASDD